MRTLARGCVDLILFVLVVSPCYVTGEDSHIAKVPDQFIGTWIENNSKGISEKLEIKRDQIIWWRKDKDLFFETGDGKSYYLLPKDKEMLGKQIINVTDIQAANQTRSKLSLNTKNLKKVPMGEGFSMLEQDIIVTLEYYSEKRSLRLEYSTGEIMFLGGNAAMGGSTHHEQWFRKAP